MMSAGSNLSVFPYMVSKTSEIFVAPYFFCNIVIAFSNHLCHVDLKVQLIWSSLSQRQIFYIEYLDLNQQKPVLFLNRLGGQDSQRSSGFSSNLSIINDHVCYSFRISKFGSLNFLMAASVLDCQLRSFPFRRPMAVFGLPVWIALHSGTEVEVVTDIIPYLLTMTLKLCQIGRFPCLPINKTFYGAQYAVCLLQV